MRINEKDLRMLIREKLTSKAIKERKKIFGKEAQSRRKARRKDRFQRDSAEVGQDYDPDDPQAVQQIDVEVSDETAKDDAVEPSKYEACRKDMEIVLYKVDEIEKQQKGFLMFGQKYRSAQEAKKNKGSLIDFIKQGLGAVKTGDYGLAAQLFCAAATRSENPRGGEKYEPINIDKDITLYLDKWCKKFGGTRPASSKGTGRTKTGKPSPGTLKVQEALNKCTDPSPQLEVDGKFGPKTTTAWKKWLTERKQFIQTNISPNITDDMIANAQWGEISDAIGGNAYPKTYGGMASFIEKVCFGKGGNVPKPPDEDILTAWDPYKVTKNVRIQSAVKRKYLAKDGASVGKVSKDEIMLDATTGVGGYSFDWMGSAAGGRNITESDNVTIDLDKAFDTGIPLCFFIDRLEAETNEQKMKTKFETSDLDTDHARGDEYIFNPIAFDLANEAFNFDALEGALILSTSWVEIDGVRKQIVKYDSSSGDHFYAVEVDPSTLMVKFLSPTVTENKNNNYNLMESLIRAYIKLI